MDTTYTEHDTERYYDAEDSIYRSIWDEDGSVHWGVFDETTGDDFIKAGTNLNNLMARKASINNQAKVLDIGCGNGNTSVWLSKNLGCQVTGIDLSGVRIGNAKRGLQSQPDELKARLRFEKCSAASLPFKDACFTHAVSQAAIYHVHDRYSALKEAYRVLEDGGLFVFDDLVKPRQDISESAKKYVYDRLLFDTDYSFETYQDALSQAGFQVLDAQDMSEHLKTSYALLANIASSRTNGHDVEHREKFQALALAYEKTVEAIDNGELGWAIYLCKK